MSGRKTLTIEKSNGTVESLNVSEDAAAVFLKYFKTGLPVIYLNISPAVEVAYNAQHIVSVAVGNPA